MTNKEILHADILDILFENRNKAYGAYALRKNYNYRLQWALGISLSIVLLLSMIDITKGRSGKVVDKNVPEVVLSTVDLPEPAKPEPTLPKKQSEVSQIKDVRIRIVPDVDVNGPEVPTVNELQTGVISTITQPGTAPGDPNGTATAAAENSAGTSQKIDKETGCLLANSGARFPGGKEAFAKFLTKYLITPGALEAGEKKTVLVRFMVDADGAISKTEVLQSDGEVYSKEVIRVLGKMPKWIPAMQNGTKVATWFTQPVSFIGVE